MGFLDNIFGGLGIGGGSAPTSSGLLGNIPRSLFGPSAITSEREIQARNQAASFQALKASGVPDNLAAAAALNPEILKTIAPAYFDTAPKLQETGTDPLTGQKSFSIYRPAQGSLTPVGAGQGQSGTMQQITDKIDELKQSGATKEQMLAALPNTIRDGVDAMISGKAIPQSYSIRGAARDIVMRLSHQIDPSFDENTIPQRQAFVKSFASTAPSAVGGQITASGTIVKHLADAFDALPVMEKGALGNTDTLNALNPIKSYVRSQSGDKEYLDALGRFETARKGIAGEMERLLSGSHGAEASKQYWMTRLGPDAAPTERRAALDEVRSLMMGRLGQVAEQKNRAFGGNVTGLDFLNPDLRAIAERISQGTYKTQQTTPQQQPVQAFMPPAGWQFSPSRKQYRDPQGNIFDISGNPVK